MRACLSIILATMLSLNAAYAATVGICDALEQKPGHTPHIWHHSHTHIDGHNHDDGESGSSGADSASSGEHHHHVHPSFSFIPPFTVGVTPSVAHGQLTGTPASAIVSAPHTLLDRPPRTALA